MVKLVYCVRKKQGLSDEEFHRYWLESHGPLVASVAKAIGARRYVQSHTLASEANDFLRASRGNAEAYEGITEVWWDSLDDFLEATRTPEGIEAGRRLLEDEGHFIDLARSRVFLTEEHEIF